MMIANLAATAMMYARTAHSLQVRKYTENPYFDHLAEVVGIVATVDSRPETLAVAWLHDVMEDQGATYADLDSLFGSIVAGGVRLLSDLEPGQNRADRKAKARDRLANAPDWVQTIKCADLISNTPSIVKHDPKFAVVYLEEKRLLLDCMTKANPLLRSLARSQA